MTPTSPTHLHKCRVDDFEPLCLGTTGQNITSEPDNLISLILLVLLILSG